MFYGRLEKLDKFVTTKGRGGYRGGGGGGGGGLGIATPPFVQVNSFFSHAVLGGFGGFQPSTFVQNASRTHADSTPPPPPSARGIG